MHRKQTLNQELTVLLKKSRLLAFKCQICHATLRNSLCKSSSKAHIALSWIKTTLFSCKLMFTNSQLGLCDMDKKYISRFFDFFSDFDFNHDFDTNRHALSYTSYLFLHILLVFAHLTCLAHLVLHFSLFYYTFYSLFLFFYLYICSCVVLF